MKAGVLLCLVLVFGCRVRTVDQGSDQTASADTPAPVRVLYPAAPGSFVDLVDDLGDSVVHVRATQPVGTGSTALGSGFVLRENDRLFVLTNDHVIAGAPDFRIVLTDGTEIKGKRVGQDATLDVALIEVEASTRLSPLRLGQSKNLRVGEWVLAVGNPLGNEVTASAGIVSSLSAGASEVGQVRLPSEGFLQTDAAIHAGNTGGPLLNMAGEVVGMNMLIDHRPGIIGRALPIDRAIQVLPMLAREGRVARLWLGVKILPVDAEVAKTVKLEPPRGALVSEVVAGPAVRAGLRRGDVILKFAGKEIDHASLPNAVAAAGRDPRELLIWRNGSEKTVMITPEAMD
jgi:serine protease Do